MTQLYLTSQRSLLSIIPLTNCFHFVQHPHCFPFISHVVLSRIITHKVIFYNAHTDIYIHPFKIAKLGIVNCSHINGNCELGNIRVKQWEIFWEAFLWSNFLSIFLYLIIVLIFCPSIHTLIHTDSSIPEHTVISLKSTVCMKII